MEERIIDPQTGGEKGQKPERYDLLPFDALDEVTRVYAYGAKKYAADNWLRGYAWRLSLGAMLRHIARWACGEDRDQESGCHHLASVIFHCLTLITFGIRGLGTDDRAKAQLTEKWSPKIGDAVLIKVGIHQGEVGTVVTQQGFMGWLGVVLKEERTYLDYQVDEIEPA